METLTLIVDREDETIYFYIWDYDATSRQLRKITSKSYSVLTGKEKAKERILWQMDEKIEKYAIDNQWINKKAQKKSEKNQK